MGGSGAAPAERLVLVHRGVGVAHELGDGLAVVWPDASADARADREAEAAHVERRGERVPDASLRGPHLLVEVNVGEDDRELVAAEPCDVVVFATERAQARARLADQLVAGLVTVEIVDPLELVEIDEQQAYASVLGADSGERRVDPLPEADAVEQAGEPVVAGLVAELVDELSVLDRGRGERCNAGQALQQIAVGSQALWPPR